MSETKILTDAQRDELAEKLKMIDAAIAPLRAAVKPFEDALASLNEFRETVLEEYGAEILDTCIGCEKLILVGDLGHYCADGPHCCVECAPTWGQTKEQYEEIAADGCEGSELEPEDIEAGLKAVQAHLDAGGSLDDKHVWKL